MSSVGYELFESVEVEISNAVATVKLLTTERVAVLSAQGSQAELHFDLGRALARLREDDAVRVVVITGIDDGAPWILPAPPALALTKRVVKRRVAEQLNLGLDAASAYEWVNFLHYGGSNGKPNLNL